MCRNVIISRYLNTNKNITRNHLEIGPRNGYCLNIQYRVFYIPLMDINKYTLHYIKENLKDYYQHISVIEYDIFKNQKI